MSDKSHSDFMREHDELSEKLYEYRDGKNDNIFKVANELENIIESVIRDISPNVEVYDINDTGETYSIRLRFDKAILIDQIYENLPEEFTIDKIDNEEGTIDVAWIEEKPDQTNRINTILKGIIVGSTPRDEVDEVDLKWDEDVDKAVDLGFEEEKIQKRLHAFADMKVINVTQEDGKALISPGDYFHSL